MYFSHIPLTDYNRLFLVWWESNFSVTMEELKTQLLPIQDDCSSIDTKLDEWNPVSTTDISLGKQSRHTQENCNYFDLKIDEWNPVSTTDTSLGTQS